MKRPKCKKPKEIDIRLSPLLWYRKSDTSYYTELVVWGRHAILLRRFVRRGSFPIGSVHNAVEYGFTEIYSFAMIEAQADTAELQ